MSEPISAFPLQWPVGWRRAEPAERKRAQFNKKVPQYRDVIENGIAKRVHTLTEAVMDSRWRASMRRVMQGWRRADEGPPDSLGR